MRKNLVPKKCCDMGSYECQVPMAIHGRRRDIDICIADIVAALNAANIKTVWSCCGHGKMIGVIGLEDGRHLDIFPDMESWDEWEKPKGCLNLHGPEKKTKTRKKR